MALSRAPDRTAPARFTYSEWPWGKRVALWRTRRELNQANRRDDSGWPGQSSQPESSAAAFLFSPLAPGHRRRLAVVRQPAFARYSETLHTGRQDDSKTAPGPGGFQTFRGARAEVATRP